MTLQTPHDIARHLRKNPGELCLVICAGQRSYRVRYRPPQPARHHAPFEMRDEHGSLLLVNERGLESVLGEGSFELF